MIKKNIFISVLCMLFCTQFIGVHAQGNPMIKGIVKDGKGKPIYGVTVSIFNEFKQVETEYNGSFSIAVPEGKSLYFSKADYDPIKMEIKNPSEVLEVTMKKTNDELIYDVAYGERSKSTLTHALSTVGSTELARSSVPTLDNAVQGLVSGLTVSRNAGGEPGWDNSTVNVRGIGTFGAGRTPLVIVDDVERDFTQLTPDEIASFTVLKDAAATALYGIRAANGVILVKTKRGYVGKTEVSLKAQYGFQQPTRLPKFLGSQEYVRLRNVALANDGLPIPNNPNYVPENYDGRDPFKYADTDWYSEMLNKTAPQQMYNISLRGGTEEVRYYVLLGMTDQRGLYKYTKENSAFNTNAKFSRYNLRSNVDINVNRNLTLGVDLAGRIEIRHTPNTSASNIITALSQIPSTIPRLNRDGSIAGTTEYRSNPYGLISQTGYNEQTYRYLQGNMKADYKLGFITKGLSANAMFAFDSYKLYGRNKSQKFSVFQETENNEYVEFGESSDLSLSYGNSNDGYYLQTTFIGGLSYVGNFQQNYLAADVKALISNYKSKGNNPDARQQNLFGRLTYDYAKRYVAEFAFSYSGSEDFIGEHRYGFFPTGSLAWVISNESFLAGNQNVSFLKLRGSYGLLGNSNMGIGRFPFQTNFSGSGNYIFGDGFAGSDGASEGRIANPNLTFEKSLNANIGLDAEFFSGKLSATVDVFRHDRDNIITTRSSTMPSIIGQTMPYENIGSVLNQGTEVTLKYQDKVGDFGYFVQGNASFARNEVTFKDEVQGLEDYQYSTGRSVTQMWGLQVDSEHPFFNNQQEIDEYKAYSTFGTVRPGDFRYVDQNNDGLINDDDKIALGTPAVPEWNFGLSLGVSYKGFDLNVLFTGVANRSMFVLNNAFYGMYANTKVTASAYDTWQAGLNENSAKFPRLSTQRSEHNIRENSVWLQKGDYIRLQNVELGYSLPKALLAKISIRDVRFFVNGYNLFSFDSMRKYDLSADVPNAGVYTYPEMRVVNVGVSMKF